MPDVAPEVFIDNATPNPDASVSDDAFIRAAR
jgi:hypothetical protein